MALFYATAVRRARSQIVAAALDGATLNLFDANSSLLVEIVLHSPCGKVTVNGIEFAVPLAAEAARSGKAAFASFKSRGELVIGGLSVGEDESADIVLDNAAIQAGNVVKIDQLNLRS